VSNFYDRVYKIVQAIPKGKVATYGQIAAILGQPRAARQVGWAMRHAPDGNPWQRVINRNGMISIENLTFPKNEQARLLRQDGVTVTEENNNFFIHLPTYLVDNQILTQALQENTLVNDI
jgi:methylated-DNA-protein-cysteine methyltransferase-like protein